MYIKKHLVLLTISLQISACGNESVTDRAPINTSYDLSAAPASEVSADEDLLEAIDIPLTILDRPIDFTSSGAPDNDSIFGLGVDDTSVLRPAPDTAPIVASLGDSAFVDITQFTDLLTRHILISFNERISAGEEFSQIENECFNGYDSSLGEPLVSLRCLELLQSFDSQIRLFHASFANTEACISDLLIGSAESCATAEAHYFVEYSDNQVFAPTSSTTDVDNLLNEFLDDRTALASIQLGASDGEALTIEFDVLQNTERPVCTYALATGRLLNNEDQEHCHSQADQLSSELELIDFLF